jgi:hypothetical protein
MSKTDKTVTYPITVFDNEVPAELQDEVYNYLSDQEFCVNFYDPSFSFFKLRDKSLRTERNYPAHPRLPLAWDEQSLEHRCPVVFKLWQQISAILGNEYVIDGTPEGMNYMTGISPLSDIPRPDGSPGKPNVGWRVYGFMKELEFKARTKSVHRDGVFLDQDDNFTLVYFANKEWHPQYYGETLFHSNDATTGDFTGKFEKDQPRDFPIGDVDTVVAPRPGRVMLFDSRYLHQQKTVAMYAPEPLLAVVFRIRKEKNKTKRKN